MNIAREMIRLRLLIILMLLCLCGGSIVSLAESSVLIPQIAPLNPEYTSYNHSDITQSSYPAGFIPPSLDLSYLKGKNIINPVMNDALPSAYDLRESKKISSIKDQKTWATSWAFASIGSLESSLLPGLNTDLSEAHLINQNLWQTKPEVGGNYLYSGGYLAAGSGPVLEHSNPFPSDKWNTSKVEPSVNPLKEILWIPPRENVTDLSTLKWAIYTYGGIQSAIYWKDDAWNSSSGSYYSPNNGVSNQAVVLAGWDDSYNRRNFTNPPPGDGAFLIKNSRGVTWGDKGYGWVSYYDQSLGKYNAMFIGSLSSEYDKIYQYDLAGATNSLGYPGARDIWGGNVYNVTSNGTLSAIGFYTNDIPTSYVIRVYKNPINGPVGIDILSQKIGTIAMSGYHIIPLNTQVELTKGEKLSLVIHLENSNYQYPLLIEYPPSGPADNTWDASEGQGYISQDNRNWVDITRNYPGTNICIKGFSISKQSDQISPEEKPTQANLSEKIERVFPPLPEPTTEEISKEIEKPFGPAQSPKEMTGIQLNESILTPTVIETRTTIDPLVTENSQDGTRLYIINATSNQLGSIYPSGLVIVKAGEGQVFRFQAQPGAVVENVSIDGISAQFGADNSYTFTKVETNHTINLLCSEKSSSLVTQFTANITHGDAPLTVQFTDTTQGNPEKWHWTFGDGGLSEEQNPIHTYTKAGAWSVRLKTENAWGSETYSKKGYIRVNSGESC